MVDVSIILPCMNEAKSLPSAITNIKKVMDKTKYNYEIILAEDGSTDNTPEVAKKFADKDKRIVWLHKDKRQGRGRGVANAIHAANGKVVGFTDTDLSTPAAYLPELIRKIEEGKDVVTAHRVYKLKVRDVLRWFLSKGYGWFSQTMLNVKLKDTETGCKFFNRERILPVLDEIKDNHWFWDTEIMVRSYLKGYDMEEMPTIFHRKEDTGSSVNIIKDSLDYFKNVLRFRREVKPALFDIPVVYHLTQKILEGNFYTPLKKELNAYVNSQILDLACGTGDNLKLTDSKYVGVDNNARHITYASKRYRDRKDSEFKYMDITSLKFEDNSFDTVLITDAIHHLNNKDLNKTFLEAKRVSKKYMVVVDMVPVKNPLSRLLYHLDQGSNIRTLKEQAKLFGKHFDIVKKATFVSPRKLYKHSLLIGEIK